MTVFDSLAAVALILFCGWVVIHSARIAWHDWGPSAVWLVAAFAMAALGLAALPDSLAEVCFWSAGRLHCCLLAVEHADPSRGGGRGSVNQARPVFTDIRAETRLRGLGSNGTESTVSDRRQRGF